MKRKIRRAEIIVDAAGKPNFIRSDWISDGAMVIDAGYHAGGIGDIHPDGLMGRCEAVTPVPGREEPMTISTPIAQTVSAAEPACAAIY